MAYSIGGIDCDIIRAPDGPQGPKERTVTFERVGMIGSGAQRLGLGAGSFAYRAVKFDTLANCLVWIESLEALQGQRVTIDDGIELFTDRCTISRVALIARRRVYSEPGVEYRFEAQVDGRLQP